MLDGVVMKQESGSTWEEDQIDLLDFCATVQAGNHVLELWGSNKCCDGETSWQFQVNDGEWMEFTTENLNLQMIPPPVEGDTVVEFGDVSTQQLDNLDWHEVKIEGTFNEPVVIMGTPSFNDDHPFTVRVKDITRESFFW